MRNRYIIEGFFKTANLIYGNVKKNPPYIYEDDLVYPFLHTIRHTYELQLKFIMYNMYVFYKNYKDGIIDFDEIRYNEIKLKHSIGDLYDFIKDNYYKLDELCENDRTNIELIYDLISDFIPEADLDPYRYAEDRQGNENMADITQVSFDKAVNSLQFFKEKTEAILFYIDKLDKEYIQVIKDIHRVLDLKIQTISLGALLLLVWNGAAVNFLSREFYVDFDNLSIRGITEFRLNRHVLLSEGKLGILEPEK